MYVLHPSLVKALDNTLLILLHALHPDSDPPIRHLPKPKDTLDNTQLRRRRIQARDRQPIIDDHPRADDGTPAIHTARDQRHLQQGGELVLIPNGRFGMHDPALVGEGHVRAGEDVVGDRLAEDFYAQDVCDSINHNQVSCVFGRCDRAKGESGVHFFGFPLQIRMHQRNVVIAANDISKRRQSLFYSLNLDGIRECVSEMLQFLIRRCGRDEEAFAVAGAPQLDTQVQVSDFVLCF